MKNKKILIINGPNLNFVGIREKDIYGNNDYISLMNEIKKFTKEHEVDVEIYQTNHEGNLIDKLQEAYYNHYDGVIINAGAYTHYSYAIRDAIKSILIPTVEVHLSNIHEREDFRKTSVIKDVCIGSFYGKKLDSYKEAILFLKDSIK